MAALPWEGRNIGECAQTPQVRDAAPASPLDAVGRVGRRHHPTPRRGVSVGSRCADSARPGPGPSREMCMEARGRFARSVRRNAPRWFRHLAGGSRSGGGRSDLGASGRCRIVAGAVASGGDRRRFRVVRGVAAVLRRARRGDDGPPWRRAARRDQSLRDHGDLLAVDADVGEQVVVEPRERCHRAPLPDCVGHPAVRIGRAPGDESSRRAERVTDHFGLKLAGAGGIHEVDARVMCEPRLAFGVGSVVHDLCPYAGGCCLDRLGWSAFDSIENFSALAIENLGSHRMPQSDGRYRHRHRGRH